MSDHDSDLDATPIKGPRPPPPPTPPSLVTKPKYSGKARIIQSSVFSSRDSGRSKGRSQVSRKTTGLPQPSTASNQDGAGSSPDPLHARPAHMLSVVELCTNNEEDDGGSSITPVFDMPMHSGEEDDNETGDDSWADHNRWYCNICKDGGELLCCDRCPRAFHMSCLGMSDDMIPHREWYCKMCSECLDRRREKKERKEKARVLRETEKLERDARRRLAEQKKEEMLAKKSVEAIELKAKRVLEMQDRILSRKKVKYKDKEEEKLGRLAEDLGTTVRSAKEKLEKLEKEDMALRRKEDALNKKKRGETNWRQGSEHVVELDKPVYERLLVLGLAEVTIDQFSHALASSKHSHLLTEIHLCFLEAILEDREDDEYVSDDEAPIDDSERYRYEIQHAPLTVGVPTRSMLTALTWPCVLGGLIAAVPRYTAYATLTFLSAFEALQETEYLNLTVPQKLAILHFLVGRFLGTEKVRHVLGCHLDATIQGTKEYNRAVLLHKKVTIEEEKKLREKQRAEVAEVMEPSKTAMKTWLGKTDVDEDVGFSEDEGASDADLQELTNREEAVLQMEDELEKLQMQDFVSRHEYVARKKKLEKQREKWRQKIDATQRKQKVHEQLERKRKHAKQSITDALTSKDALLLRNAIERGKECNLPDRILVTARHVLEILDTEAIREEEAVEKKRKLNALLRESFVRTEPIGRDHEQLKYWIFKGDSRRLYIEQVGRFNNLQCNDDAVFQKLSPRDHLYHEKQGSTWSCYGSQTEINLMMEALDVRHPREAPLRLALSDQMVDFKRDMPVSKPGLLISDLLNDETIKKRTPRTSRMSINGDEDMLEWRNDQHAKRKASRSVEPGIESFREEFLKGMDWISKCLRTLGSTWPDRLENGGIEWRKAVAGITTWKDFARYVLILESELMATQTKHKEEGKEATKFSRNDSFDRIDDKSDDEDDEDDEVLVMDDKTALWPSKYCRERWIQIVERSKSLAVLATSVASLIHRLEVVGFLNISNEGAIKTRAKSTTQPRKERAVKKKQVEDLQDEFVREASVDEWDEDCYLCNEGGELVCCDGCPHVFHYSCIGLRRIPRGKIFCHECDTSVHPVNLAYDSTTHAQRAVAQRRKQSSSPISRPRRQKQPTKLETSDSEASKGDSESEIVTLSSMRPISSKFTANRQTRVDTLTEGKNLDDQWDTDCSVCGLGGELLCCDGCPRAFHVNCIGLSIVPATEWFCNECNLQTCGTCKKNKIRLDAHVICGSEDGSQGCDRVFHLKCAKLEAVPADDWYCKKCRTKLSV
ncbi:hypothetical protein CCR75_002822 [Bremia lactucae]|uniref:PHD-type domain-containing protein n=1 Tax=Bremia lactucae TaxID=4779 RepID=A0A976FNG6_BRELC|nr:hypothetical protein CCR75_002822 [Bremia lactucae]